MKHLEDCRLNKNRCCTIYLISNTINDKLYVGQTWQTLKERFINHTTKPKYNYKFGRAIIKHGKENFIINQIAICFSQLDADEIEDYFITRYDTINKGYNTRRGGSHGIFPLSSRLKMK